jgi:putative sterol carrier protein
VAQTVQEFFETLPSRVRPEHTAGVHNSYLFEIADAGSWLVLVDDGTVTVAPGEGEAHVRIRMSEEVFQKLLAREQSPTRAFMSGKVKVKGDIGAAKILQKLLG